MQFNFRLYSIIYAITTVNIGPFHVRRCLYWATKWKPKKQKNKLNKKRVWLDFWLLISLKWKINKWNMPQQLKKETSFKALPHTGSPQMDTEFIKHYVDLTLCWLLPWTELLLLLLLLPLLLSFIASFLLLLLHFFFLIFLLRNNIILHSLLSLTFSIIFLSQLHLNLLVDLKFSYHRNLW